MDRAPSRDHASIVPKMAANTNEQIEVNTDDMADKKPSKESLSQVAGGETKNDSDLDQLLESALGDFDKPCQPPAAAAAATASPGLNIVTTKTTTTDTTPQEEKKAKEEPLGPKPPPNQDALFEALFSGGPAAQQSVAEFENVLSGLMTELGGQELQAATEMQRMFQGMASGLGSMPGGLGAMTNPPPGSAPAGSSTGSDPAPTPGQDDLGSTLTDTLNRLAQNARDLQEDQMSDEDLLQSLGGMSMSDSEADLLPMVQNMMQSLLSKDVLYPSLKEVVDKYKTWLVEHEPTLSGQDYERYSEQHELMGALCTEYEGETDSDSAEVKQQRMGRIMELIQKMESLGQPPAEIVGDMNTGGLTFDENGLPRIPGLPQGGQCSVM